MFPTTEIDLGIIHVGEEKTISFPYSNQIATITRVESSCECASVSNYTGSRKIEAKFKPKDIPQHLKDSSGRGKQSKVLVFKIDWVDSNSNTHQQKLVAYATVIK